MDSYRGGQYFEAHLLIIGVLNLAITYTGEKVTVGAESS